MTKLSSLFRRKNMLLTFIILMLLVSMTPVRTQAPVEPTVISLDTQYMPDFLDIYVDDVEAMWGFEIWIQYNSSLLNATNQFSWSPFDVPQGDPPGGEINNTAGYVALRYSYPMGEPNGLTTPDPVLVASIEFTVVGSGWSLLRVSGPPPYNVSKILDVYGDPISHDVVDGFFANVPDYPHDVAVTGVDVSPTRDVVPGELVSINVSVANQAPFNETFTVTAYANTTAVDSETVSLDQLRRNFTQLEWDTTGFAFGHYNIRTEASVVTNETETTDNTLTFGDIVVLGVHDIALTNVTASPRYAAAGDLISINVTVVNRGDFAESFSVTAKCGYVAPWDPDIPAEYMIDTKAVASMPSGTSRILTFTLDTSKVAFNPFYNSVSLWIEASASVVPYETAQANNKHKMDGDVTLWTEHAPLEHELTVSLEVPAFLEPGRTSLLNATVQNGGLNNETTVDLFLLINGTAVSSATIPELPIGASYTINYSWTPLVEATFNVTVYAPPVPDEDVTANNVATKMVIVRPLSYILFDQTHGTDMMAYYSLWVANLTSMGYVVESLTLSPITLSLLEGYDVFVIPEARDYYSSDELSAIQDFVLKGSGLLVIGDDNPPIYTSLTDFAGIDWMSGGVGDFISHDITPHEVTEGINSVFLASPFAKMSVTAPALGLVRDPTGGIMLAVSEQVGRVIGFADENSLWDYGIGCEDNLRLAGNMIDWLVGVKYEHELAVTLDAPDFLEPGDSSLLNATVSNGGLNNETDVELSLLINGTEVNHVTIPELANGTSHTIDYLWSPTVEGTYNVTVYAPALPGENVTTNNVYSAFVTVRFVPRILAYVQFTDYWQEYANSLAAIDSTFGRGYVLTELLDYTQLDSMLPGNDVLFIPEQEYMYLYLMVFIGTTWSETLSNFLEEGGVIIVCDHGGGTYGILIGAGLMSISGANYITGSTVYLVDPTSPLANGVSSSFTAPNGALSFVTDETNVVFDDGTYPVVIHKKVGAGHIALIGFDYYASNPDTEQILGNAVNLALHMTISINPSAGSPGTQVTVTGVKATANGAVEIYWDDTFIGDITADAFGNFAYLLTVPPNAAAGLHEIRAVDVAKGETSSRTFRVIFITISPVSGPMGTKATVNGAGFPAYTQVRVTFDDMQMGYATTDGVGNFAFVFNIPLSEAGSHSIKAWFDLSLVETSFTVIDVTPLEIQMDVGAIFFKGETAEFYVQTCLGGVPVNVSSVNVTLCKPDGTAETLTAQRVATGFYKIEYSVKGKGSMVGTYVLLIECSCTTSTVDAKGACIKSFLVKEPYSTLEKEGPKAALVTGSVGTILALAIIWRKRKQPKE